MKFKQLDDKLKEKLAPINLAKKFPGYFSRWIFIVAMILIFALEIAQISVYNHTAPYYDIVCPQQGAACPNPLRVCKESDLIGVQTSDCQVPNSQGQYFCPDGICYRNTLMPGFELHKHNEFIDKTRDTWMWIILAAFLVNHLFFMLKHRRLFPRYTQ